MLDILSVGKCRFTDRIREEMIMRKQDTPALVATTFADTSIEATLTDVAGQLAPTSKRVYGQDAKVFAAWLNEHRLAPHTLTRQDVIAFRAYLAGRYPPVTANRIFSVARRLIDEQVKNGILVDNPFKTVKGFKVANETTHTVLKSNQARALLAAIDRSSARGKRDYALLMLLLRTGIRRSECAALTIGDIQMQEGHHVAIIQHGKGNKRRTVKLPVDVFRAIQMYLESTCRAGAAPTSPLFTGFVKGGRPTVQGISDKLIERVVKQYATMIGVDTLTPHGLRASFITLALENKATLHQVQYAAGHADPRTTERYHARKLNLDDNAVDYIKL